MFTASSKSAAAPERGRRGGNRPVAEAAEPRPARGEPQGAAGGTVRAAEEAPALAPAA